MLFICECCVILFEHPRKESLLEIRRRDLFPSKDICSPLSVLIPGDVPEFRKSSINVERRESRLPESLHVLFLFSPVNYFLSVSVGIRGDDIA